MSAQPMFRYRGGGLALGGRTYIMGILNITPDSFSDGGLYADTAAAVKHGMDMARAGANIIDIGGQSTRPGFVPVCAEEEWRRLSPVLDALLRQPESVVSIDTFYPDVAEKALRAGAHIINDVSGNLWSGMAETAAKYRAGLVLTNAGSGGFVPFCRDALNAALRVGLTSEFVCFDPGIGFGKDRAGDLRAVKAVAEAKTALPHTAILAGASRKRVTVAFVPPDLGEIPPQQRLPGTVALHTAAQLYGADILRVHDVSGAVQAACVIDALKETTPEGTGYSK